VGGQYGSEGKGKVAHYLARERRAAVAVRVGGPNSGHTIYNDDGLKFIFRQLPTAAVLPNVICLLAAGTYIDVDCLMREMTDAGLDGSRLKIDRNAVVITEQHRASENKSGLRVNIGSTLTGTGAAVIERTSRNGMVKFARDDPMLAPYLCDTKTYLREILKRNGRVILEGTQGYGLSMLHTECYPFATSRDTTAAGFLSEIGLSPFDVDEISLVIRAFPIRVPGNSGPLEGESNWTAVTAESGSPYPLQEITSVTKSIRRIASFTPHVVLRAIEANQPSMIVINHADYWDFSCRTSEGLTKNVRRNVDRIERLIGARIDLVGTTETILTPLRSR
jgi:adenylosuccinate synthase